MQIDNVRLHVTIEADGNGGASEQNGSGPLGIRHRAQALDGTMTLTSPPGGPNPTGGRSAMRIVIAEDDPCSAKALRPCYAQSHWMSWPRRTMGAHSCRQSQPTTPT